MNSCAPVESCRKCENSPEKTARRYLYNNNVIAFVVFIVAIVTAQFWFEFFYQVLREWTGMSEPQWYIMLLVAIFWTLVVFVLIYAILKLPIAAGYSL